MTPIVPVIGDAIASLSDRRVGKIECFAIAKNGLDRGIRKLFVDRQRRLTYRLTGLRNFIDARVDVPHRIELTWIEFCATAGHAVLRASLLPGEYSTSSPSAKTN